MKTKMFLAVITLIIFSSGIMAQVGEFTFSKTVDQSTEVTLEKIREVVKAHGFGIINELPMHEKIKEKVPDADVKPYYVLGICNPKIALKEIQADPHAGAFIPCKAIVRYLEPNKTEVVIAKPNVTMTVMDNPAIMELAEEVTAKLEVIFNEL